MSQAKLCGGEIKFYNNKEIDYIKDNSNQGDCSINLDNNDLVLSSQTGNVMINKTVADLTSADDKHLITKEYVDTKITTAINFKDAVRFSISESNNGEINVDKNLDININRSVIESILVI